MFKCPTCSVISDGKYCSYCARTAASHVADQSPPANVAREWPRWLTAGRGWVIIKLGSFGILMLVLAVIFATTIDISVAVYPLLGCLLCFAVLGVFFWRWTRESPRP